MVDHGRRTTLRQLGAAGLWAAVPATGPRDRPCRVRTLTLGVPVSARPEVAEIEPGLAALAAARRRFEAEGYEVQTLRLTTSSVAAAAVAPDERAALFAALERLDRRAEEAGVLLGVGSLTSGDVYDPGLAGWIADLLARTKRLSCSIAVATPADGARPRAAATDAAAIRAIARVGHGGLGNFRFAAAANVPAGTPFFPVGWHEGPPALAVGLESAGLVAEALASGRDPAAATRRVRDVLGAAARDVETVAAALARELAIDYRGVDPSPAPARDRSIGTALESLIGAPFGSPGTLEACTAVTAALRSLPVRSCGYAGLMLPPPEDPGLARRVDEGRVRIADLLLYSSVCGTGLDCIPLAGDSGQDEIERLVRDVAALAARWQKALSARLLPVPGRAAGEVATFDDPLLAPCRVMAP
jgi:uncharacterized protein (UPF0210 family)